MITKNVLPTSVKTFSFENYPQFLKKYSYLISDLPNDEFLKKSEAFYKKQALERPIVAIVDNKYFKDLSLNKSWKRDFYNVSHGILVRAFGDLESKGRVRFKTINKTDDTGHVLNNYVIGALSHISELLSKGKRIKSVNFSFGNPAACGELSLINPQSFDKESLKKIINANICGDSKQEIVLEQVEKISELANQDIKMNFSAGNKPYDKFNILALSKFLTKKPENVNVTGGVDKYGDVIEEFCHDKRIVNKMELAEGVFFPVLSTDEYKILGWKLNDSHSLSIKANQVDRYPEIKVSNKFSGLTVEQAKNKIKKLNAVNSENNYAIVKTDKGYALNANIKVPHSIVDVPQSKDDIAFETYPKLFHFTLDADNRLVSEVLENVKNASTQYISGTSFASPITAVKEALS